MVDHVDTLKYWMEDDDCVVMDRGFRDVLELFSTLGYNAKMSSFWPPVTRQQ